MASLFTGGKFQALGPLGILPGAGLYTYAAGTTTPLATYTNQLGSIPNANPVVCNALGQADVWLGTASYHFILKDAFGVTVWDVDNIRAADVSASDLASGIGGSLIATQRTESGAVLRTLQQKAREQVSVFDFGAVGDGVTDDTAAFNRATQSTTAWSSALEYDILVPTGPGIKYKLNGTVYVRKGQTLRGVGTSGYIDCTGNTTTNSMLMGSGLISGSVVQDAGGNPVCVENFFFIGGAPNKGVVGVAATGFSMNNLFFSAVGIALEIVGGDGIINNIEIDQSLTAISLSAAQNIAFTNFNIYLPSYAIAMNTDCRDITFSNGIIEYAQYAAVLTPSGQMNVKGITFSNVNFTMNAQYTTFLGYVYTNAGNVEMQFTGCSFRNWYQWAINHSSGVTAKLTFTGCVFDATRTTALYAQSTTAKVLNTVTAGGDGTYSFFGCEFRNLPAEIATLNDGITKLNFIGGYVVGCDANAVSQKRFNVSSVNPLPITVKNVVGFPYVFTSGANRCANLPWWGASTAYKVAIKGNNFASTDAYYSAAEESMFSVTWQMAGATKSIYADRVNIWQTPNRTAPGQLTSVVCLGTAPGGSASTTTFATTGSICVSVAFSNQANFDFYAETAT